MSDNDTGAVVAKRLTNSETVPMTWHEAARASWGLWAMSLFTVVFVSLGVCRQKKGATAV